MSRKLFILVISFILILSSIGIAQDLSLPYDENIIPENFSQSSMLDEAVEKGNLPPVDDRVPDDPYVVEPNDEIGDHGGTLNTATTRINAWGEDIMVMDVMNSFVKPSPDADKLLLNFAKDIEVSEDQSTYTFYLREGVKWSDGEPFTTEDIEFWYEDLLLNEEYTPVIGEAYKDANGEIMELTVIDDNTFEIEFGTPQPFFLETLVHETGWNFLVAKHFLKEYHPDYVSENELEEKLEEYDYDSWYELLAYMDTSQGQANMIEEAPTLGPYVLINKTSDRRVWERNPYYWKVDSEGNQLPYIDKIDAHLVSDREVLNGEIMSGEIDFAGFETDIRNYPMFKNYEDEGGYRTLLWTSGMGSEVIYMLNQTVEDDDVREIFQNKQFRQALSIAIDRDEINESIYFGKAKPRQYTVLDSSKYFEEKFESTYTEFNPEKAQDILDEIGLKDQNNDGWRELPNGEEFTFTIEYYPSETPKTPNVELVVDHWKNIGINVNSKEVSGELQQQRAPANMMDATIWHGDKATDIMFPHNVAQLAPNAPVWGSSTWPEWGRWFSTDGEAGQEPPEYIKEYRSWFDQVAVETDEEKRIDLGKKILESQAENLWLIGTVGEAPYVIVANENLKNVPEDGLWCWDTLWSTTRDPEQFYFED